MRQQLITTFALFIILCAALLIKVVYFPVIYGYIAYYFISIFWICGMLMAIFLLNIVWQAFFASKTTKTGLSDIAWPNRRKTFRIIYPSAMRPKLVMETADNQKLRNLEFPVLDLSQEGGCFLNDGSLGDIDQFSGCIYFDSGDHVRVAGHFIRQSDNQVSVRFNRPIHWSTLLQEQRRVMSYLKSSP